MSNIMNIGRRKGYKALMTMLMKSVFFYKMCINQFTYLLSLDIMRWRDMILPKGMIYEKDH